MEEKLFELRPIPGKDLSILIVVLVLLAAICSATIVYFNIPKETAQMIYLILLADIPVAFLFGYFLHNQYKKLQNTKYDIYNDRIEIISCMNNVETRTINISDINSIDLRITSSKEVEKGSITIQTKAGGYYVLQNIPDPQVIHATLQQKIAT